MKRLDPEDAQRIHALRSHGHSVSAIARMVSRNRKTVALVLTQARQDRKCTKCSRSRRTLDADICWRCQLRVQQLKRRSIKGPGEVYGALTTIEAIPGDQHEKLRWSCRCVCGEIVSRGTTEIVSGRASCGCQRLALLAAQGRQRVIDLTGRQFYLWRALRYDDHSKKWECKCRCGTIRLVFGLNLRQGRTMSCGCWRFRRNAPHIAITKRWGVVTRLWRPGAALGTVIKQRPQKSQRRHHAGGL